MRNSIRWTLIGWYGALLTAVLAAFGATLYWQASSSSIASVDAVLSARATAIAGAMEWDEEDGWEVELSDDYLRGIGEGTYFRILGADGSVVREGGTDRVRSAGGTPALSKIRLPAARGTTIVVGRSIARERDQLASLLAMIVIAGGCILALSLCIALWLARRALVPVGFMSSQAASISECDLSARIDEQHCPVELADLARAFNGTLGRLESAFQRQTRFTADASHELRTPVTILRAQVERALKHPRSGEEYRASLQACLRAAERMTSLVEGLLTLARADAKAERTARQCLGLEDLVRTTVERLGSSAETHGVTLSSETEPVTVEGDPELLGAMLTNVIHNAVRYNRPGGRVEVVLRRQDGHATLAVEDTGIGISPEAVPHVFERFYRADAARSREAGGSGLGLAIAHWIVEAHGGSIEVFSELGVGSRFTIRLPASPTELAPGEPDLLLEKESR